MIMNPVQSGSGGADYMSFRVDGRYGIAFTVYYRDTGGAAQTMRAGYDGVTATPCGTNSVSVGNIGGEPVAPGQTAVIGISVEDGCLVLTPEYT